MLNATECCLPISKTWTWIVQKKNNREHIVIRELNQLYYILLWAVEAICLIVVSDKFTSTIEAEEYIEKRPFGVSSLVFGLKSRIFGKYL